MKKLLVEFQWDKRANVKNTHFKAFNLSLRFSKIVWRSCQKCFISPFSSFFFSSEDKLCSSLAVPWNLMQNITAGCDFFFFFSYCIVTQRYVLRSACKDYFSALGAWSCKKLSLARCWVLLAQWNHSKVSSPALCTNRHSVCCMLGLTRLWICLGLLMTGEKFHCSSHPSKHNRRFFPL